MRHWINSQATDIASARTVSLTNLAPQSFPILAYGDKITHEFFFHAAGTIESWSGAATDGLRVTLGDIGAGPFGGLYTLACGETTSPLPFDANAAAIEAALNALPTVAAEGKVTVAGRFPSFLVTWLTVGSKTELIAAGSGLVPESDIAISPLLEGDASTAASVALTLRRTQIDSQTTWSRITSPANGWSGTLNTNTTAALALLLAYGVQVGEFVQVLTALTVERIQPSGDYQTLYQTPVVLRAKNADLGATGSPAFSAIPPLAGQSGKVLSNNGTSLVWSSAGTGTVSSVALSLPDLFDVSGSPVTTSGTLSAALAAQPANTVLAGPTTGADAAPTMRALTAADIPDLSASYDAAGSAAAAQAASQPLDADLTAIAALGTAPFGRGLLTESSASTLYTTLGAGSPNGIATLDVTGKLLTSQLPNLAVVDYIGEVANETEMLALSGQRGDWCNRSDTGTVFFITGPDPTQLSSWTQLNYPTAPVTSVAGRTGAITLAKADVGLGNVDNTSDAAKPVSTAQQTALDAKVATSRTVNGHALSSDVTVTKSDVGLGNVDNTSDAAKPISTATQTALDAKAPLASPALTGTPTAPTAAAGTSTTQIATTAFTRNEVTPIANARAPLPGLVFDGIGVATSPMTPAKTLAFTFNATSDSDILGLGWNTGSIRTSILSGSLRIETNTPYTLYTIPITLGKTYHIVYVGVAGSPLLVYLNGVLAITGSNNLIADITANTGSVIRFGANHLDAASFIGTIASPQIYNRALSAAEVLALSQSGTPASADFNNASNTSLITGTDSTFDSGLGAWVQYGNCTLTNPASNLVITTLSGNTGGASIPGKLVLGARYRATFTASTSLAQNFYVDNNASTVALTTTPTTFSVEFTASNTTLFLYQLATSGDRVVTIDNVTLYRIGLVGAWDYSHLTLDSTSAPALPGVLCGALTWTTGVKPSVPWSGTIPGPVTVGGKITGTAATTAAATLNLPHGAAPTTPADGDVWSTTAGLYARINGVTVGPYSASTGGSSVSMAATDGNLVANTTYYSGAPTLGWTTTAAIRRVYVQRTGTIKRAHVQFYSSGTAGSGETVTAYLRINNTTDLLIGTVSVSGAYRTILNSALSQAITAGDYVELKVVTPAWATAPTFTSMITHFDIE